MNLYFNEMLAKMATCQFKKQKRTKKKKKKKKTKNFLNFTDTNFDNFLTKIMKIARISYALLYLQATFQCMQCLSPFLVKEVHVQMFLVEPSIWRQILLLHLFPL